MIFTNKKTKQNLEKAKECLRKIANPCYSSRPDREVILLNEIVESARALLREIGDE